MEKKRETQGSQDMAGDAGREAEPHARAHDGAGDAWIAQLVRLEEAVTLCPADVRLRCDLAALLEQLGQHEEALVNWSAVLTYDSNSLPAREGMARCRRQAGRPLQSSI